jgi:hypothetical protein
MTRRKIARRYPVRGAVLVTYRHAPTHWYVTRPNRAGALHAGRLAEPYRSKGAALVAAHRENRRP